MAFSAAEAPFPLEKIMDPSEHESAMGTYMEKQLKSIKNNPKLRQKLIDACKEARKMNII